MIRQRSIILYDSLTLLLSTATMKHNARKVIQLLEEIIKNEQVAPSQIATVRFCISVIENNIS